MTTQNPAKATSATTSPRARSSAPSVSPSGTSSDDEDVGSQDAEQFLRDHPWVVDVARAGWTAKGVVYLLIGVLALALAWGPFREGDSGGGEASQAGAIAEIAEQPFGVILLWTMAIGLVVYSLWRFVTVVLPAGTGWHAILRRIGYAISGLTYVALAFTAISLTRRPGSLSGGESEGSAVSTAATEVLAWSGGRLLVGLAGLGVIGVGVYFLRKGLAATFESQLEHRQVGPFPWKMVRLLGRAGWTGRAIMMALIGGYLTLAAIQLDPHEARGLDASLNEVASSTVGKVMVYAIAIGLVLYGAFCVISTPIRKLVATDEDTVKS